MFICACVLTQLPILQPQSSTSAFDAGGVLEALPGQWAERLWNSRVALFSEAVRNLCSVENGEGREAAQFRGLCGEEPSLWVLFQLRSLFPWSPQVSLLVLYSRALGLSHTPS